MSKFQDEYLQHGWEMVSSFLRILCPSMFILILFLMSSENPYYWRGICSYPICFIFVILVDKFYCSNKKLAEIFLMLFIIVMGLAIIVGNLKKKDYYFNEHWTCYILITQYIGYFFYLKWRKIVICFYLIMSIFVILLNLNYNGIPFTLYSSVFIDLILYPLILIFISRKIKEMIILLKTKKDLIHTIKSILQVFPEGVIIRSVDPITQKTVIKFANDVASKLLKKNKNGIEFSEDFRMTSEENLNASSINSKILSEFLDEQEIKIDLNRFSSSSQLIEIRDCSERIEEIKEFIRNSKEEIDNEDKSEYYNIKSIKVQWENLESFMHVFINTTQIKKLEKEKASRECQQTMFTSLSHDMRTPLNAITNSLQLIGFTVEDMRKKLSKLEEASSVCSQFYPRFERFIMIGDISSCLLLNLVEDILDLAKFSANMFKLNINPFKLDTLLNEIDSLFDFQCTERGLRFRILCDQDLANSTFESDAKRIKQVLINLVSNSIKFTEKGEITIKVSKFEDYNKLFLKFKVRDTGVGINNNDFSKLFNKFSMLQKHMKFNACGSGIGLSISKMIVESLGGQISVSSEEGEWTQFRFCIECSKNTQYFKCEEESKLNVNEEFQKLSSINHNSELSLDLNEEIKEAHNRFYLNNMQSYSVCDVSVSREVFKEIRPQSTMKSKYA